MNKYLLAIKYFLAQVIIIFILSIPWYLAFTLGLWNWDITTWPIIVRLLFAFGILVILILSFKMYD